MMNREILQTVEASIAQLPDDMRQAITLREMDGLSYEEIARVVDCPIGTVRSRIFRARELIAKICGRCWILLKIKGGNKNERQNK